jgi:ribulose-phosphate 3-epimerase
MIIPTVFAKDKKEFNDRYKKILNISDNIQIDFMDGEFVGNKSVSIKDLPRLNKKKKFEAHLMVEEPSKIISKLASIGFSKVIIHYEVLIGDEIIGVIKKIRKYKMKVFLGLNPATTVSEILPYLNSVDGVLVMGVNPGQEGQKFINKIYDKIKKLRTFNKNLIIQIDGGINLKNAARLGELGVDILNSGSFVYESDSPKSSIKSLENEFLKGRKKFENSKEIKFSSKLDDIENQN